MGSRQTTATSLAGLLLAGLMACAPQPEPRETLVPAAPPSAPPPKILRFYASPGVLTKGESATICYGVENAESVSITPNVRALKPGWNRCFSVTPAGTTTYTLTAAGAGGEASASFTITVRRAAVASGSRSLLTTFLASSEEVSKGQPVTLCYAVDNVKSVDIEPPVRELEPQSRCFTLALA